MSSHASIVLRAGAARVVVEPTFGGRLSSLSVAGVELLWQPDGEMPGASHPFGWGSFVMAPFAGRVRRGELKFDGKTHQLAQAMPPHAIHGTVFDTEWEVDGVWSASADGRPGASCELSCDLGPVWPFRGVVHHRIELSEGTDAQRGSLTQHLRLEAADAMPVSLGWHPWFPRLLPGATGPLEWTFDRAGVQMFQRDDDGIATADMTDVPPGPWDDCFAGIGTVTVRWPGLMELTVDHDCPVVVLFDGLDHAVCVEPQTGPPDAAAVWGDRATVAAGDQRSARTTWTWTAH